MTLQKRNDCYAWMIVFLCVLLMLVNGFTDGYQGIWLSAVTEGLGISRTAFSISNSFRFVTAALVSVVFSTLLQRLGIKKMFTFGYAFLIVSMLIHAVAEKVWLFYLAGILKGIGIGLSCSAIITILLKQWVTKNLGTIMGVVFSCTGLGAAIGSQVMTPILFQEGDPLGFRDAYKLNALVMMITGAIVVIFLREKKQDNDCTKETPKQFQAVSEAEKPVKTSVSSKVLVCFVIVCVFFCNALLMGINSIYSAHMRDVGLSTEAVAGAASVLSVLLILSKTMTGVVFDKFGLRYVLLLCQMATLLGFGILASLHDGFHSGAMLFAVVFPFALPLETIVPPLIVEGLFDKKSYNKVLGYVIAATNIGFAVGPPIVNLSYDLCGTYVPAMIACMVFMAVIMVAFQIVITAANKNKYTQAEKENLT